MGQTVEELEAQLAMAKLEAKLVKAKGTKKGPSRELKADLREARMRYRAARDGQEVVKDERGRLQAVDRGEA